MRRLTAIALVLLLGLTLVGAGYARWFEILTIDTTVNTGELDWEFTSCLVLDTHAPPVPVPDYSIDPGFVGAPFLLDKNVGWGTCDLVDTDTDMDMDTVLLGFHNVYPSYFNSVNLYMRNNGTIPLRIQKVVINGLEFLENEPKVELDLTGEGDPDVEIWWRNNFGHQMEPGDDGPEISFWFHVLQPAPEDAELEFEIQIEAVQWNEYVAP
jgi:hypothetical protein